MSVLLVTRVPKNLILLPIEIVLVHFGMKLVNRIYGALPNGKGRCGKLLRQYRVPFQQE